MLIGILLLGKASWNQTQIPVCGARISQQAALFVIG